MKLNRTIELEPTEEENIKRMVQDLRDIPEKDMVSLDRILHYITDKMQEAFDFGYAEAKRPYINQK